MVYGLVEGTLGNEAGDLASSFSSIPNLLPNEFNCGSTKFISKYNLKFGSFIAEIKRFL